MQSLTACLILFVFFAVTFVNVAGFERNPTVKEIEIPVYNGFRSVEMRKISVIKAVADDTNSTNANDDNSSSMLNYVKN